MTAGFDAFLEIEKYAHTLLGRLAIDEGLLSYPELLEALEIQHNTGKRALGAILEELGYIKPHQLDALLKKQKKLKDKSPELWPTIPDTVLKGMLYFGGRSLGKVERKHFLEAEQLREQYCMDSRPKSLADILAQDLQVTSLSELQQLQREISFSFWECSGCERRYQIFNCDAGVEIPCPVCWDIMLTVSKNQIEAGGLLKLAHKTMSMIAPKRGGRGKKKAPEPAQPRVGGQLAEFYESLKSGAATGEPTIKVPETAAEAANASAVTEAPTAKPPEAKPNAARRKALASQTDKEKMATAAMPGVQTDKKTAILPQLGDQKGPATPKSPAAKSKEANKPRAAKINAPSTLKQLYEMLEKKQDAKEKVAGRKHGFKQALTQGRGVAFVARQTRKLYALRWICLGCCSVVVVTIIVGWYLASKAAANSPAPPSIVLDLQPQPVVPPAPEPTAVTATSTPPAKDRHYFQEIVALFHTPQLQRPQLTGGLQHLAKLIQEAKAVAWLGDYYNLRARVLVWSAMSFAEGGQKADLELLQQGKEAAQKACQLYAQPGSKTIFAMPLMPWMWEAKNRGIKPWEKQIPILTYEEQIEVARRDMEQYLEALGHVIETIHK